MTQFHFLQLGSLLKSFCVFDDIWSKHCGEKNWKESLFPQSVLKMEMGKFKCVCFLLAGRHPNVWVSSTVKWCISFFSYFRGISFFRREWQNTKVKLYWLISFYDYNFASIIKYSWKNTLLVSYRTDVQRSCFITTQHTREGGGSLFFITFLLLGWWAKR